ncbi:MAG: NADH-quinone oxidoreductase subunit C [Treponema sp.]|nr:NADH-quinone oxidoreductase subunit C [Treponema sp.]
MRDITIIAAAIPAAEVKDGLLVVPAKEIEGALDGLKRLGGFMLFDISAVDRPTGSPAPQPAASTPGAAPGALAAAASAPASAVPGAAPAQSSAPAQPCFELSYRFMDMREKAKDVLTLRVIIDRDHPVVPSVARLWPAADVLEREVWDLMGIEFSGRLKQERILLKSDFVGHPLRKDFVAPKRERFPSPSWDRKAAEGGL